MVPFLDPARGDLADMIQSQLLIRPFLICLDQPRHNLREAVFEYPRKLLGKLAVQFLYIEIPPKKKHAGNPTCFSILI